eukprot:TRINITY_DN1720_c0_g1_i2.p1 TRINITY_DN1720_c0_g1~~TRINITY_DN1720_c0_g1_i2.p1  ORF type:complete len:104 (+),score=5.31 TRINITY_DN1720_c0_g1_i2:67-378(+)
MVTLTPYWWSVGPPDTRLMCTGRTPLLGGGGAWETGSPLNGDSQTEVHGGRVCSTNRVLLRAVRCRMGSEAGLGTYIDWETASRPLQFHTHSVNTHSVNTHSV